MKSLTQFIKESQEIHESLIGDVVRKLLDTSLSWIEGSVKWIANKSAEAVGEVWKTHRDVLTNTYSEFRRSHPEYRFLPETIKTPEEYGSANTVFYYSDSVSADHKIDKANKFISKLLKNRGKSDSIKKFIVIEATDCYVGIIKNPKVTPSDKSKADKFLKNVKSSVDDDTANLLDSNIKHYISEM